MHACLAEMYVRACDCGGGGGGRLSIMVCRCEVTMQSSTSVGGGIIMGCLPPLCVCEDVS